MDDKLNRLWRNAGFPKEVKFYRYLKENNVVLSQKAVNNWLSKQSSIQRTREVKKPKAFETITSRKVQNNYQMDIMIYTRREYNGWNAIIGVIDVKSRYAMCLPLKTRKQKEIDILAS